MHHSSTVTVFDKKKSIQICYVTWVSHFLEDFHWVKRFQNSSDKSHWIKCIFIPFFTKNYYCRQIVHCYDWCSITFCWYRWLFDKNCELGKMLEKWGILHVRNSILNRYKKPQLIFVCIFLRQNLIVCIRKGTIVLIGPFLAIQSRISYMQNPPFF